jgi:hypothetical protein
MRSWPSFELELCSINRLKTLQMFTYLHDSLRSVTIWLCLAHNLLIVIFSTDFLSIEEAEMEEKLCGFIIRIIKEHKAQALYFAYEEVCLIFI